MRRILVATLATLTVVIGLSAGLIGTASAATPVQTKLVEKSCTVEVGKTSCKIVIAGAVDVDCTISEPAPAGGKLCAKQVEDGTGAGDTYGSCREYNNHGIYNILRGESRYRLELDRDRDGVACEHDEGGPIYGGGGPRYNDCNEYRRNNIRDIRRGDARYVDSWDRNRNGVMCDDPDVIVSNDGDCITIREGVRNYGTRYNSLYNERIDRARSVNSDGGTRITDSERRAINDAADLRDFRSRYDIDLGRLRTVCEDKTPPVVIVNAPPAPATVTAAPPAPAPPVSSSGGGGSIPSGSVNTGGDSVAFTLAHNRVA